MTKQRIQVYADYEVKRRVELAAALYGVPVTEYCLSAIRRQLQEDDLLERAQIQISVKPGTWFRHFQVISLQLRFVKLRI